MSIPRKSVQKSSKAKSAMLTRPERPAKLGERLHTARGIPINLRQGKRMLYDINVRPYGEVFHLYNRDIECGDRLWKGNGQEKAPNPFPLMPTDVPHAKWDSGFWMYRSLEAAIEACELLQDYLDQFENPKLAAEIKRYAKMYPDEVDL